MQEQRRRPLYLKQIELQGFKSFPDRTKLTFGHGATVIIGPNGSGKSNIADAMRWVLGEISSKSLRGTKMEDIIFGGADSRKPMGYAEVSVTFDNTDKNGRIDCPYDEITVTRRYYRNGDSEYFINRKEVRLRDVYEMFLNTGVGRDGYSIIGQGRIADIVSRKSDERRGIFEDAAGIAKYRHKKNDAERKLAATSSNMERAQDIIDEIGSRLGPLERECVKAKRYIEYTEIKKQADVRLWLYDTEKLRLEIADGENELAVACRELDNAAEALETLEAQNDRLDELSKTSKAESEKLLSAIKERTRENYAIESELKVADNDLHHTEAALSAALAAAQTQRGQAESEKRLLESYRASALEHAGRLQSLAGEEKKEREAADSADKAAASLDDAIAVAFDEIVAAQAADSDAAARLELIGRSKNEGAGRRAAAEKEIAEYRRAADMLAAECAATERTVAGYDAEEAGLSTRAEVLERELAELRQRSEKGGGVLSSLNAECDALSKQIDTLKRMEEHFEGYNNSVRHVMQCASDGRLSAARGCGRVYGPVSKLIQVDGEYVTAIETALGAAIQNIVVDDEDTVKAAIECLKRDRAGRATFCPVSAVKGYGGVPTREMSEAARYRGYVGVASELVKTDDRFKNVISSLLGRTVIFDDLDNAIAMSRALGYGVRAVTLDGQQINRGGTFTGGSVRTGSGILTRAEEIKKLSSELADKKTQAERASDLLADISSKINDRAASLASNEDSRKLIATLRSAESAKLEKQKAGLDADRTLISRLCDDLSGLEGETERCDEELAELEAQRRSLAEKISELTAFRSDREAERGARLNERDEHTRRAAELTVKLSEARKDIESANAMTALSESKIRELEGEIERREAEATSAREKISALNAQRAEARTRLGTGETELERLNRERAGAENSGFEFERKINELRRAIRDKQDLKEGLGANKMRCETRLERQRADMETLSARLWEDHELTRSEALALGYPPITEEERPAVAATQIEYRNKIRNIGSVNTGALEEYNSVRARYDELTSQMADLTRAKNELEGIISKLEEAMKRDFSESFDKINENFSRTFNELFGGGSAQLTLTDPDNVLESGIEIKAAPPGKIIKSLMQLSGGEQAFVAIALFFAILQVNPTPFCILDEIEAALDEVNVERLAEYIQRYSDGTQFIMITHRRGTMNAADRLYGITMPERGISNVFELDVDEITKQKGSKWDGLFE